MDSIFVTAFHRRLSHYFTLSWAVRHIRLPFEAFSVTIEMWTVAR